MCHISSTAASKVGDERMRIPVRSRPRGHEAPNPRPQTGTSKRSSRRSRPQPTSWLTTTTGMLPLPNNFYRCALPLPPEAGLCATQLACLSPLSGRGRVGSTCCVQNHQLFRTRGVHFCRCMPLLGAKSACPGQRQCARPRLCAGQLRQVVLTVHRCCSASERRGNVSKQNQGLLPGSQGHDLASTILCVSYLLDRGF